MTRSKKHFNDSQKLLQSEKCIHYLWYRIVLNTVRFKGMCATVFRAFISALYCILKSGKCVLNLQLPCAFF